MTVRQNLEFPLRMVNMPKRQIQGRVEDAAAKLGLTPLLDRRPKQLSGGQRQRVAMGRAIVRDPSVFLMDEPLSNLDAKMRTQIRTEIADLQRKMQATTVYVTHDQVEAMTMGDRVAVMRAGELQQIATPQDLYDYPANIFVAGFIGSPAMNLFYTRLQTTESGTLAIDFAGKPLAISPVVAHDHQLERYLGQNIIAGLRPEAFSLAEHSTPSEQSITVDIQTLEALGHEMILYGEAAIARVEVEESNPGAERSQDNRRTRSVLIARVPSVREIQGRNQVTLAVDSSKLYLFTGDGQAITSAPTH
jgi:multiple sugar transport system ATP-binding protein